MMRKLLLERIDERIRMNDRRIINTNDAQDKCAFENNSDLLRLIKSVLENAEDSDKTYEQGMRDIWGLFQKIYDKGGYKLSTVYQIFGYEYIDEILERMSPGEALFRMREYEDKKKKEAEKPVIGDVVEFDAYGGPKTGILLYENSKQYWVLISAGECPQKLPKDRFKIKKTGKHVDLEGLFE